VCRVRSSPRTPDGLGTYLRGICPAPAKKVDFGGGEQALDVAYGSAPRSSVISLEEVALVVDSHRTGRNLFRDALFGGSGENR
jgi:hypothetical protein